jgi:hypothetical protein
MLGNQCTVSTAGREIHKVALYFVMGGLDAMSPVTTDTLQQRRCEQPCNCNCISSG